MANTTLLRYGYSTVTLHDGSSAIIKENSCVKDSSLAIMPLYLSDSDETDVFDYGGVTKTISLNGVYIAETTAALKTWIESLEAMQQGHQDTEAGYPLLFTDDLRGAIRVKCLSFNSTAIEGQPTKVIWSIKLVQSSENA